MKLINVRVPDEYAEFVQQEYKRRNLSNESEMWRLLIERGLQNDSGTHEKLDALIRLNIQVLCVTQRHSGHVDEALLELAHEDAKVMMDRMKLR